MFSGPTGSGKTTLVRACLGELEPHERVVVIEDTAELDLFDAVAHPNVESWEARLANNEGEGAITQGEQVKHALRYRPDWLVCGEVRDSDAAVPMLKAMTHGQSSLTTVHSASAIGALDKLALYLGTGDDRLPPEVAHNQLHQAIDFVVHLERGADGRRHVTEVLEVAGFDGQRCTTNTIMTRDVERVDVDTASARPAARTGPRPRRIRLEPPRERVPMRTLAGAIVGLLAAGGVWLAIVGWTGVPESARPTHVDQLGRCVVARGARRRLVRARGGRHRLAGGGSAGRCDRMGRADADGCPTSSRRSSGSRVRRSPRGPRCCATPSASHAGLQEAIGITAQVAPAAIRKEVQALSVRAERGSLTDALRQFAVDVDDPVADLVVASLAIAAERQAQRLSDLLSQIAVSAREQTAMRLRVETGRARTYASSKALVAITFGLAVVLMVFSPTFMEPYDTATGQLVLIGIGALFAGALWGLVQLGSTGHVASSAERDRRDSRAVMLFAMVLAGSLAGGGVALMLRGAVGSTPPLSAIVAELHRPRTATHTSTRRDQMLSSLAGRPSPSRAADLAVCERTLDRYVRDRFVWAAMGATPALVVRGAHGGRRGRLLPAARAAARHRRRCDRRMDVRPHRSARRRREGPSRVPPCALGVPRTGCDPDGWWRRRRDGDVRRGCVGSRSGIPPPSICVCRPRRHAASLPGSFSANSATASGWPNSRSCAPR